MVPFCSILLVFFLALVFVLTITEAGVLQNYLFDSSINIHSNVAATTNRRSNRGA